MRRRSGAVLLVLALAGTLAGCGDASGGSGTVPATGRSTAWVATQHLDREPARARAAGDVEELGAGAVGADLTFAQDGAHPANRLTVAVGKGPGPEEITGCPDYLDGCERVGDARVLWQEEEPEEDPGVLYVVLEKGDDVVVLYQSTQSIHGDPRRQDLDIGVDDMVAIAQDPRLGRSTTREAVDGGNGLDQWKGADETRPPGPKETS